MELKRKKLFNPDTTERPGECKLIGGNPTNQFNLASPKYKWADSLLKVMYANTWFPEEVSMGDDKRHWVDASEDLRTSYKRALAQLIFLDSIQTNNLVDNINCYITAPEVNMCFIRQAFEESVHSKSYQVILEAIASNPDEVYELWRTEPKLKEKNIYILNVYESLAKDPDSVSEEDMVKCFYANQILEGIYFYSGFLFFYALAHRNLFLKTASMIRFIHRDEVTHLLLFQNCIHTLRKERPELFTKELLAEVSQMFKEAIKIEKSWAEFIFGNNSVASVTVPNAYRFINWLAYTRMTTIGLSPLTPDESEYRELGGYSNIDPKRCPIPLFVDQSNFNTVKTNFFESKPNNYAMGSLNMDDF